MSLVCLCLSYTIYFCTYTRSYNCTERTNTGNPGKQLMSFIINMGSFVNYLLFAKKIFNFQCNQL